MEEIRRVYPFEEVHFDVYPLIIETEIWKIIKIRDFGSFMDFYPIFE